MKAFLNGSALHWWQGGALNGLLLWRWLPHYQASPSGLKLACLSLR